MLSVFEATLLSLVLSLNRRRHKKILQLLEVDGLGEVMIEARSWHCRMSSSCPQPVCAMSSRFLPQGPFEVRCATS